MCLLSKQEGKLNIIQKVVFKTRQYITYSALNFRRLMKSRPQPKIDSEITRFVQKGFIKSNLKPVLGLSSYLAPVIKELLETGRSSNDEFRVVFANGRGVKTVAVDPNADFLFFNIFTRELYELIRGYYGKTFYLRNNPTIEFSYEDEINDAQKFHLDWGLQQVSLMVNLSDVEQGSTHMIYLTGSNRRYYFSQQHRDSEKSRRDIEAFLASNPDCQETTLSARDGAFVFDAGNGFHRQVAGGFRVMLHLNFVENLAFTYWDNLWMPDLASNAYWFAVMKQKSLSKAEKAGIPVELFSLIERRLPGGLGVPKIYTTNRKEKRTT